MQQTPPTPPALPTPVTAEVAVTIPQTSTQAITTAEQVAAARIRLDDLRRELQDAAERRASVASRLRSADVDARPGFQARLAVLDNRIIGIEQEITQVGIQLRNAPAEALVAATPAQTADPDMVVFSNIASEIVPIVAIISLFVLAPIALAISRLIWRRATHAPRVTSSTDPMTQQKLDQLQQAVDTIAIEVERISEGQRFVTRLMNERSLPAGAAEPVRAGKKATVPSERG